MCFFLGGGDDHSPVPQRPNNHNNNLTNQTNNKKRVDVRYEDKRPKALDIHECLSEWFPSGHSRTRADFEAAVASAQSASPPDWPSLGRQVGKGRLEGVEGAPALELRHVKLSEAPAWFKALHGRVEPLLIFTVDGASFVDAEDPRWEVVVALLGEGEWVV